MTSEAPAIAAQYVENRSSANAEHRRQHGHADYAGNVEGANGSNLLDCENRPPVTFSNRPQLWVKAVSGSVAYGLPTLRVSVTHVFKVCSLPQVGRVAARRIVASVQHAQPWSNRATRKLECDPVCSIAFPIESNFTVSVLVHRAANPRPATGWRASVNLAPKSDHVLGAEVDYRNCGWYLNRSIWHVHSMLNVRAVSLLITARRLTSFNPFPAGSQSTN